jgi:hypothetical protein
VYDGSEGKILLLQVRYNLRADSARIPRLIGKIALPLSSGYRDLADVTLIWRLATHLTR